MLLTISDNIPPILFFFQCYQCVVIHDILFFINTTIFNLHYDFNKSFINFFIFVGKIFEIIALNILVL